MSNIGNGAESALLGILGVESVDLVGESKVEEDERSDSSEESSLNLVEVIDLEGAEWGVWDLESGFDVEQSVGEDPGSSGDRGEGGTFVPVLQVPEEEGVVSQLEGKTPIEVAESVLLDCSAETIHESLVLTSDVGVEKSLESIQRVEEGFESRGDDQLFSEGGSGGEE